MEDDVIKSKREKVGNIAPSGNVRERERDNGINSPYLKGKIENGRNCRYRKGKKKNRQDTVLNFKIKKKRKWVTTQVP